MMIAQRAVRGVGIVLISSYANLVIGFITTIALTRLLSPEVFGLFALGTFFYSLTDLRNKLGLDYALVHRQPATQEVIATHWLLQVGLAGVTVLIGLGVGWLLPLWGYQPGLAPLLLALCLLGVVEAAGSTARTLLEKELRFGRSTLVVSGALLISNGVAVILAWSGAGIWSLVTQMGVNVLVGSIGFWYLNPIRPRLIFSAAIASWMIRFGLTMAVGALATIVLLQGDNFLVGTLIGAATLGFYERAYKVAQWPTGLVTHVISRVSLPTYAKLQDDPQRLSKAFELSLWVVITAATPLALALFVTAPDFIRLVFGEVWAPSGLLLRFLVGYAVLRPLLDDVGALLVALGKPHRVSQLLLAQAATLILFGSPLTLAYGAPGTAIGVGLTFAVGLTLAYRFVLEVISLDWRAAFGPPLLAAVVALGVYSGVAIWLDLGLIPLWARVILKGGLTAFVFLLAILLIEQRIFLDRISYVRRLLALK